MARPRKIRTVSAAVGRRYYKPQGIPLRDLAETVVTLDALEAMRLVDAEGLDQRAAARAMEVSPATVSRLLAEGRRAVAEALCRGWALRIEGGPVEIAEEAGRCRRGIDEVVAALEDEE
ncbi:MAG: DUF134 domain-containing protein [Hyphomicrobiales bacterium]|nr:DUF134 domain-containing protein [Hyphomicrobiales bacterium]